MKIAATAWAAPVCPPNQMRTMANRAMPMARNSPPMRHGQQIHRRGRGQRGKAVQQHREDHQLHEEQRDATRPSGFARLLDGVTRGRVARHREAHLAALIQKPSIAVRLGPLALEACYSQFAARPRQSTRHAFRGEASLASRLDPWTTSLAWQVCGRRRPQEPPCHG